MSSSLIVMALPQIDFDPTEVAITWSILHQAGYALSFATPQGTPAQADFRMVTGKGLLWWSPFLRAHRNARLAYEKLRQDPSFLSPFSYEQIPKSEAISALILPGGHAQGMKEYLESLILQERIVGCFRQKKPVAAICHGTLLVARSRDPETQKSVLYGRKTTTLPKDMELCAWGMTCLWLKNYYRTYPRTTQEEVCSFLKSPQDFQRGPFSIRRDHEKALHRGFVVEDDQYLSARWPGDAHRFASTLILLLQKQGILPLSAPKA